MSDWKRNPSQCPQCGSIEIQGGPVDISHPWAIQDDCSCLDCNAHWKDYYTYHHYYFQKFTKKPPKKA